MTTNREFLNDLANNDPHALDEWMSEEHVFQSDMVNCGKPFKEGDAVLDSAVIKPTDSREKLEADMAMFCNGYMMDERQRGEVRNLLDRQAAITKSEWAHVHDLYIDDLRRERDELERKLETLLCTLTNGKWSKSSYAVEDMISMVRDEQENELNETIAAERDEWKSKVDDLQIVVDCVDERVKRYCKLGGFTSVKYTAYPTTRQT